MMGDRYAGKPSLTNHLVNSALHPSGVAKSSTSFGWRKGGNVTSAGWQVTLCDPIWHVSSRSGELQTAIPFFTLLYFTVSLSDLKYTLDVVACRVFVNGRLGVLSHQVVDRRYNV